MLLAFMHHLAQGLTTSVSASEGEPFISLRTQESCAMQLEYTVSVDSSTASKGWRRMRITTNEEQGQWGGVQLGRCWVHCMLNSIILCDEVRLK